MRLVNLVAYPLTFFVSRLPTSNYGLKLLTPGVEASIDVVMVHGLDGHWKDTWTSKNGTFWPKDLLPQVLPNARVFSYGYDSRTHASEPMAPMFINDYAVSLVTDLVFERAKSNTSKRPIIFVVHSLGGLILKDALIHSDSARVDRQEAHRSIYLSTLGLLFLGTPHQGGQGANLGKMVAHIGSLVAYTSPNIINHLSEQSEFLQKQQRQYAMIATDFQTVCFYETMPMKIGWFTSIMVVPKYSAVIPNLANSEEVSIAANHKKMVKFESMSDENFEKVAFRIKNIASTAKKTADNWHEWERTKVTKSSENSAHGSAATKRHPDEFVIRNNIPYIRNEKFVGREPQLASLDSILNNGPDQSMTRTLVLHGTGGIGKTQLAIEFAYAYETRYSAIFWLDGSSLESTERSIEEVVRLIKRHYEALGCEDCYHYRALNSTTTPEEIPRAFQDWLFDAMNRNWLVIFDNVDDLESFDIKRFIPHANWGKVIVTSRRSESVELGTGLLIDDMEVEEAMALLQRTSRLHDGEFKREQEFAKRIVTTLGYLPLAIHQAGAYIATRAQENPLRSYFFLHQRDARTVLAHKPATAIWDYRNDTVFTTWEISFSTIHEEMPLASHILLLCGFLDRKTLHPLLFTDGLKHHPEELVHEAIQKLLAYSLIRKVDSGDFFSMHPLVHRWVRERLEWSESQELSKKAIVLIHRVYHSVYIEFPPENLLRHLVAAEDNSRAYLSTPPKRGLDDGQIPPLTTTSLFPRRTVCSLLWAHGHIDNFLRYIRGVWMRDPESSLDPIQLLYQLGVIYRDLRNHAAAERFYRWTLKETWHHYPHLHPRALAIAGDLGKQLLDQEKLDDAQVWYNWTLQARECVLGKSHPATMGAVIGLGIIMKERGQYEESLQLLFRAYEERKKTLGPDDILTRNAMNRVAYTLSGYDDPEAANWHSKLLKIRGLSANPESIAWLADHEFDKGRMDEAMRIAKHLDGLSDTWSCWFQQFNISIFETTASHEVSTVIAGYKQYLALHEQCLQLIPDKHISAALRLATLYLETNELASAMDLTLEISRFNSYPEPLASDGVLKVLNDAITAYGDSARIKQALEDLWVDNQLCDWSVPGWPCCNDNQCTNPFVLGLLNLKARWLRKSGRLEEALAHYTLLHTWTMQTSKRPKLDEAIGLSRKSCVLSLLHRYKEVIEHSKRVLQLSRDLGEDCNAVMDLMNIASVYWRLEDYSSSFYWCHMAFTTFVHAFNTVDDERFLLNGFLYRDAQRFVKMFFGNNLIYEAWILHIIHEQGDKKWVRFSPNPGFFFVSVTRLKFWDLVDDSAPPSGQPALKLWYDDKFH